MKWKKLDTNPDAYVLIFDAGDEITSLLTLFVQEQVLSAASFRAIGALSEARLGWYNPDLKRYDTAAQLDEQIELVSLTGDVGKLDGKPVVHAHCVIARRDGSTAGGHLLHAITHPTCELFLVEYPDVLVKQHDDRFNLNLFRL